MTNAADDVWYYRHSNSSTFSGYVRNTNSFNGLGFGTTGTWYWIVQARDANGTVLAQSATRNFTVAAPSGVQPFAMGLNGISQQPSAFVPAGSVQTSEQPMEFPYSSDVSEQVYEMEYEQQLLDGYEF